MDFKAYRLFKEHKVLPITGAMFEQNSFFHKVIDYCDTIFNRCEEEKQKEEVQKEEFAKAIKNL